MKRVRGRRYVRAAERDEVRVLLGDLDERAQQGVFIGGVGGIPLQDGVELAQGVAVDDVDGAAVADFVIAGQGRLGQRCIQGIRVGGRLLVLRHC